MTKFETFMEHARKAVNRDIYLWGGGQPLKTLSQLSESYIKNKETSTVNANRVIRLWDARKLKYPDAYAADCSGGIVYCMMLAGLVSNTFDANANGLMGKCKALSSASDLIVGDWVGQKTTARVFHIGIVDAVDADGQIWIIEWRGRDYGCVRTKIQDGARPWNVFGRPLWVYDSKTEITKDPTPLPAHTFNLSRTLKLSYPYMKGDDVVSVQGNLIAKGFSCGSTGADGIFGGGTDKAVKAFQKSVKLKADGIVGKNMEGFELGVVDIYGV